MSKIKEAFHEEISAMPVPPRPAGKLPPRLLRPMKVVEDFFEEFFNAIGKAAGE
jgi:hypothetical protein